MGNVETGLATPITPRVIQLEPFEALSIQNREDTDEAREFALQFNSEAAKEDTVYTPWIVLNDIVVPREGTTPSRYTSIGRVAAFVTHWTPKEEEFTCDSARVDTFILTNAPEKDIAEMLDPSSISPALPPHEYSRNQGLHAHTFRSTRSESLAHDEIMEQVVEGGFVSILPPLNAWRRSNAQKSIARVLDRFESDLYRLKQASESPVRNPQLEGIVEQPVTSHGAEI